MAQMFPIKSLQKPLVTGALFFLHKLKVIIFMHTEPLKRTPGRDAEPVCEEPCGAARAAVEAGRARGRGVSWGGF